MSLIPPPQCIRDAMNADVVIHPSAVARGLETARKVIKAPRGTYTRKKEDAALYVLLNSREFMDNRMADQFIRARQLHEQAEADREALERLRKDWNRKDPWGTAAVFISAGFLIAMLIAVAVAS